jgi:uridine kinase
VTPAQLDRRRFAVGIAGPSCSGKTTLALHLQDAMRGEAVILSLDSYYLDLSHLSPAQRELVNFDHPEALDWPLLVAHIGRLAAAQPVEVPIYSFEHHLRLSETQRLDPAPVLILEGLHALHHPRVRSLLDVKVYLDVTAGEALARRLDRDVRERGRTPDSVTDQFRRTVEPMWRDHIEPAKEHADHVLTSGEDLAAFARNLAHRIFPGV